jgi:hypothetical protein
MSSEAHAQSDLPDAGPAPAVGSVFRQSLVYSLAGVLLAYDKGSAAVRSVVQGVHEGMSQVTPPDDSAGPASPSADNGVS